MSSASDEFEGRFAWRKDQWVRNLQEITAHAHQGGPDIIRRLPGLRGQLYSDDPIEALRWSVLMLWLQATECYILGQFQSSILTAGAVLERILKLEYRLAKGSLPKGKWPLGRCINDLEWSETRITEAILTEAKACVSPRNSRAHALLENEDPQLSIMGGPNRGIQVLSDTRYLVEPYRNDCLEMLGHVWAIMDTLYTPPPSAAT